MFRILTNRAKSWLERRKRDGVGAELEREAAEEEPAVDPARFSRIGSWASPPLGWEAQTPEALLSRLEEGAALRRAVDALPAAQRLVVTLRDLEGLDAAEVCEMLDVSEANQRVLLHRGRSKIRTFIEAQEQRRRTSR